MSRHRNFRGFNPNALSAQLDLDDEDIEEDLENELSVEDEGKTIWYHYRLSADNSGRTTISRYCRSTKGFRPRASHFRS